MALATRAVGCVATTLLVVAACDPNYVEGRVPWRSDDGRYAVEYITPPWTSVEDDGQTLRLEITAELFGTAVAGSPPTHVFSFGPVDVDAQITDLLPPGAAELGTTTDLGDVTGGDVTGEGGDTDASSSVDLSELDLGEPQQIALVELDAFVTGEQADLIQELQKAAGPDGPWSFEVVIAPGVHVRSYYFDDGDRTIRAAFAALFTLSDGDVATMADTIVVGQALP